MALISLLPRSRLWLLQTTEQDERFSDLTIALIVIFLLLITIISGLLLRPGQNEITRRLESDEPYRLNPWEDEEAESGQARRRLLGRSWRRSAAAEPPSPPVWLRSAGIVENVSAVSQARATLQRLLDAAANGRPEEGFALYSESYLARFRDSYGLDEETFAAMLRSPATRDGPKVEVESLTGVESRPDGAVEITARYAQPPGVSIPAERYRLVKDEAGRWLIDDIRPAD